MIKALLTLAVVVALGLPAAAQARPCATRGGESIDANQRGRVYYNKGKARYFGCLYGTNKSYALTYPPATETGGAPESADQGPLLAGRYAAIATSQRPSVGVVILRVRVRDLRTGRTVHKWRRHSANEGLGTGEPHTRAITDLELERSGSVAWIVEATVPPDYRSDAPSAYVMKSDRSGRNQLLDTGAGIGFASLALSDSTLYWMNDGQPRTAPLY